MLLSLVWITQIVTSILLIALVLLHSPKGDGIAAIGGASQMFSSQKSAEEGLNKLTYIVSAIFLVCTFLLGFGLV